MDVLFGFALGIFLGVLIFHGGKIEPNQYQWAQEKCAQNDGIKVIYTDWPKVHCNNGAVFRHRGKQ